MVGSGADWLIAKEVCIKYFLCCFKYCMVLLISLSQNKPWSVLNPLPQKEKTKQKQKLRGWSRRNLTERLAPPTQRWCQTRACCQSKLMLWHHAHIWKLIAERIGRARSVEVDNLPLAVTTVPDPALLWLDGSWWAIGINELCDSDVSDAGCLIPN